MLEFSRTMMLLIILGITYLESATNHVTLIRAVAARRHFYFAGLSSLQDLHYYSRLFIIHQSILHRFLQTFSFVGVIICAVVYAGLLAVTIHLRGQLPLIFYSIMPYLSFTGFVVMVIFMSFASSCHHASAELLRTFHFSAGQMEKNSGRRGIAVRRIKALKPIQVAVGVNGFVIFGITAENLLIVVKLVIDMSVNFVLFFN